MALRMNIYGWSRATFARFLGSHDAAALAEALASVSEALPTEPARSTAGAWLRTLVNHGFPFREDRSTLRAADDGGLPTVLVETEPHAIAVYTLMRAASRPGDLDLAGDSSTWTHDAVGSLYRDLAACGFTKSRLCPVQYFTWMSKLSNGSPLFADEFRSDWSFYCWYAVDELAGLVSTLRATVEYRRPAPPSIPPELVGRLPAELSEGGKQFAGELAGWFDRLHAAGQDAFVMWW